MLKTLLVVLFAAVVAVGCGDQESPAVAADRSSCARFDSAVRSIAGITATAVPELAKEQARLAASQAESAADGASGALAAKMRGAADRLAVLAGVIGRAQQSAPAGPLPDLSAQLADVRADVDAVTTMCRHLG